VLQSRTGRDRAPDFPHIAQAAGTTLPPGTVLDGELVAWHKGHFAFEQLLRSRAARERDHIPTSYVAFDCLATPAEGDVREHPLQEWWETLSRTLADIGPPLEVVLAGTDRTTALAWYEGLAPLGVEGLVCRGLASRYRPADRRAWVKVRHADTVHALVVGIIGTSSRPYAVLLQMPTGRRTLTPKLDAVQARQIADALGDQEPPGPTGRGEYASWLCRCWPRPTAPPADTASCGSSGLKPTRVPVDRLEHMSDLPLSLPPDRERLQTIRAWVDEQNATIGTFLDVLAETLDAALAAAAPAGPPNSYRIQRPRASDGHAALHRGDCWIAGGSNVTREEALLALADDVAGSALVMCEACQPEDTLRPEDTLGA
jgi:hypothetical protein